MRTIIAGSRDFFDYDLLCREIEDSGFNITQVISGKQTGIDKMGERYAEQNNIPLEKIAAEWSRYGKSAGLRRNQEMAKIADAVIIIRKNNSKESTSMLNIALDFGLKVHIIDVND